MCANDYVLGTHEEEIERLGLQHRIWRPLMLNAWMKAGLTVGSRVVDFGAGPGYAALDAAEIVGVRGEVTAIERSPDFLDFARRQFERRQIPWGRFVQADLDTQTDADELQSEFRSLEKDTDAIMVTPLVVEIIAEKI